MTTRAVFRIVKSNPPSPTIAMLPSRYLTGVRATQLEDFPGVFAAADYRSSSSSRFVCSYDDGRRHKLRLFQFLARLGQREARAEWDLHHVVEGQHFADIDFAGRIRTAYAQELPVVLIHKNEHVAYNQLLHVSATDEMFRDALPDDLVQRSRAAAASAARPAERAALRARVARLAQLYDGAYAGDAILQRIARNVLDDALLLLR